MATKQLRRALIGIALLVSSSGFVCRDDEPGDPEWPRWGGDLHNHHHAAAETAIGPDTVRDLKVRWRVETTGNVSAIPALTSTRLYVPDAGAKSLTSRGSMLYTIDRDSGDVLLQKPLTDYSHNLLRNQVRATPAIDGDLLIFGDLRNQPTSVIGIPGAAGASLYAVNRITGDLVWKTTLDTHPLSITTMSPTVYDGLVYVGVSSYEEAAAKLGYQCCTFAGSMVAVDARTGRIVWRRSMIPPQADPLTGFSGAAVWGSAPSIDAARGVLYIATGNNYTLADDLEACVARYRGDPEAQQRECYDHLDPSDNYSETVLALDLKTGASRWVRKMHNYGAWTFACDPELVPWLPPNPENCEDLDSLDYDFGQAPMLVTRAEGAPRDLVIVGQKSGVLWAFDADTGATVWATAVGPGGVLGGMEFGAATDGHQVYVQITNFEHEEFPLIAGAFTGQKVRGGIWAAVDVATGAIRWQTPDPASFQPLTGDISHPVWGPGKGPGFFGVAMGPITVANGVVFAGSMDREGHMYALDASSGRILWSFVSGGSVMSAPAIADGQLFWGSGYSTGFDNNALYSFGL